MKKGVCVRHLMTTQNLQEVLRVQKKLVDFVVVQIVIFDERIVDELFFCQSIMSEHRYVLFFTSKICFKINELIRQFFHLIYN